jgi:eukaryotic-like serine/threonine-protein kinase
LMAGTLAAELAPKSKIGEDAFLGSMFQNLGRLLTEYYFTEEAQQIRFRLPGRDATPAQTEAAATQVLGISFHALGLGVAKAWGLPDTLQNSMLPPTGSVPTRALPPGPEYMRWLGHSANALADAVWAEGYGDEVEPGQRLASVADQHATALGLSSQEVLDATDDVRQRMGQAARAMGLVWGRPKEAAKAAAVAVATPASVTPSTADVQTATSQLLREGLATAQSLASVQPLRMGDVVQAVLHTVLKALQCRCVVLCLRDAHSGDLTGRFSAGGGAQPVAAAFRIHSQGGPTADLFSALCALGADTLIADAQAASVAKRLPEWYRSKVKASTFLLLPLMHKNKPVAALYADKQQAGSIELNEANLLLVKGLRDLLLQAFGQGPAR